MVLSLEDKLLILEEEDAEKIQANIPAPRWPDFAHDHTLEDLRARKDQVLREKRDRREGCTGS